MKKYILILVCVIIFFSTHAQQVIQIPVKDAITTHAITAKGELFLASDTLHMLTQVFGNINSGVIDLRLTQEANQYKVKIVATKLATIDGHKKFEADTDYDTTWIDINVNSGMSNPHEIPTVFLNRHREKRLQEVTVTASKVMFYNKGDTLIYNADAFILSEGSMLDALITQLPGVELQRNGVIYCNGERIDNLLLNGKDLFNGNNELMLQNLGAYTVKDIAVYDKSGHTTQLMGIDVAGDKTHVMDVRLKRQYSHGFIVNVDGGYGTKDKFLARLFSMWFSDNISVTLSAGVNNLSDYETPGQKTGIWSPTQMTDNVTTRKFAALTYTASGREDIWNLNGSIDVSHIETTVETNIQRTNFLPTHNTYEHVFNNSSNTNLSAKTSHRFFFKLGSKTNINVTPSFKFSHIIDIGNSASLTLREKLIGITQNVIFNIYNNSDSAAYVINRCLRDFKTENNQYIGSLSASSDIKLKDTGNKNMLTINVSSSYNSEIQKRYNRYSINTGITTESTIHENQFIKGYPTSSFDLRAGIIFTQFFNYHLTQLPIKYDFTYNEKTSTSSLYLLNELSDYSPNKFPIGTLPSKSELNSVLNRNLSYQTVETSYSHVIGLMPQHSVVFDFKGDNPYSLSASASAFLTLAHKTLDYNHALGNQIYAKNFVLPELHFSLNFSNYNKRTWSYLLLGDITSSAPSMINYISLPITDPLNIFIGNSKLSTTKEYSLSIKIAKTDRKKRRNTFQFGYKYYADLLSIGYLYDMTTGVRTFCPTNINGNMSGNASYEFFLPFGSTKQFDFTTKTIFKYRRSADYIGAVYNNDDMQEELSIPINIINSYSINEQLKLNWRIGAHRLSLFGNGIGDHYTGNETEFHDFTSWTFNCGLSATFNLPHNWSISTDVSSYNRRGFSDSRLNSSDFLWNARLSKSILKGGMTFVIDAYDILHQLSNISYSVNAQARTEMVTNVIPSYLLFHINYRFNANPKRK